MNPAVENRHRTEIEALQSRIAVLEAQLANRTHEPPARDEITLGQSSRILQSIIESSSDPIFMKDPDGRYVIVNSAAATAVGMTPQQLVGRTDLEIMPEELVDVFTKSDRSVLESRRSVTFEEPIERNGKLRVFLTTKTLCRDQLGNVIGIVGFARDITDRKKAEQLLRSSHDQLEERVVQRTQQLLTANRTLEEDRTKLADMHRQLKESHQRFSLVANSIPVPIIITRLSDDRVVFANICALDQSAANDVLVGQRSINYYHDPTDQKKLLNRLEVEPSLRNVELRVRQVGGSLGYVAVSMSRMHFEGEPAVLSVYLDITRIKEAEESLRTERQHLRRAVDLYERDQQLTAYEIHDGIVQDLTAALMFLESYRLVRDSGGDTQPATLDKSKRLIQRSIDEARRMINGLRPPILEDQGIAVAVENLVTEIQTTHGLQIDLDINLPSSRLDSATEMAIYRIVQESINNVWRHSKSERACIRLLELDGQVNVLVRDWGDGFDAESEMPRKAFGIRGIRERAKQLGGSATIQSRIGAGTTISVDIPLDSVNSDDLASWAAP